MKMLILDDSMKALAGIEALLPGSEIKLVPAFEQIETALKSEHVDCIVLDISSIDYISKQPVQRIRRISKRAGLIITSDKDLLQEKIELLVAGADDFLIKPYDISELAARIISVTRRVTTAKQEDLIYNEIRVDVNAKMVFVNNLEMDLTKKELELLLYFIEHKNSIIQKESLISYLSGQLKDFKSTTDIMYAHIKNLKKKLNAAGCNAYLKTVYGLGYKWEDL